MAVNIGDENDANARGVRLTGVTVVNPPREPGGSAQDAFAIVNCWKVLVDHCRILNCVDDGVDSKSYDVAVINCYVYGTGRNAVKFWRNGELINSILHNVTHIDDGAIIVDEGPFRMIHSLLLGHPVGYAGAFSYNQPSTALLEIVNSGFGECRSFYTNSANLRALNNRFFNLVEEPPLFSGAVEAADPAALNALPACGGNALSGPPFVNPAAGDFSLLAGSDWINAGADAAAGVLLPSFDLAGKPRIVGSAPDTGPLERSAPASAWISR